ncbi:hypothetical protein [Longimicrobium terrae]|uniref:Uncharacterized protein n=1 Tax=Longimicrobium terrae TaxID=1639882 RepID=A0A841GNP6_9BACT|nr:hypothetical protein [Longimicrobium terrae]MBB4634610.1 hypothetical protein [Longimicrobium terrae]MBB6068500.1 hypothetical protein [Longimicrobium terrae]NNC27690.1 hypothetical protein [Longimicrobium terrae]
MRTITPRSLYAVGLLSVLSACGVDRTPPDTDSGSGAEASRPDPITTVGSAGSSVPAFVTDSMPAGDSAPAGGDSSAIRSVYTSLAEKDCRVTETDDEVGGSTSRCPGTAGYALMVHDYDARMSVDIVAPGGRVLPLRYSGVITANFSAVGERAEWRMRGANPIALIVRLNANEDPEDPARTTSYLAVAKITPGAACVTDRIAPTTPNANEAARQAADRSATRPCMRDLGEQ